MPLTREQMDRVIDEHFRLEAADDVDGVLGTLSPEATHDVVGWPGGVSTGREKARGFYEQLFSDLAEGSVKVVKRLYGENFVIDESVWRGRAPGRPFGVEGRNRALSFRLLHVLEFNDAGQISRENVWLDMPAIMQQLKEA